MLRRLLTFGNLVIFLVVGIFLNLGYIGYMAFYPFKTVEIHNQPLPIVNKTIHPGDVLTYTLDYCRFTRVPSDLTRTLIGPTTITIATDTATADPGCRKINISNTVIPPYAPLGEYYLKINVCFHVNPLRNICQQIQTQYFKVE